MEFTVLVLAVYLVVTIHRCFTTARAVQQQAACQERISCFTGYRAIHNNHLIFFVIKILEIEKNREIFKSFELIV